MPNASALVCPSCAAPTPPALARCPYCGSALVFRSDLARLDSAAVAREYAHQDLEAIRAAVARDSDDAVARHALGLAYLGRGLLDDAAGQLAIAADLMPEHLPFQIAAAAVLDELVRRGERWREGKALGFLERARTLSPNDPEVHVLIAAHAMRTGNLGGVAHHWRSAATADPMLVDAAIRAFVAANQDPLVFAFAWRRGGPDLHAQPAKRRRGTALSVIWLASVGCFVFAMFPQLHGGILVGAAMGALLGWVIQRLWIAKAEMAIETASVPSPDEAAVLAGRSSLEDALDAIDLLVTTAHAGGLRLLVHSDLDAPIETSGQTNGAGAGRR